MFKIMMVVAVVFLVMALGVGCVFLRSSDPQSGVGVIRSKTGRGGGTYQQQQVGADRGFRGSTSIAIAPSYSFEVQIDGLSDPGRCSLTTDAAARFEVGQRVQVQYIVRGMKPIWSKVFVTSMEPAQ